MVRENVMPEVARSGQKRADNVAQSVPELHFKSVGRKSRNRRKWWLKIETPSKYRWCHYTKKELTPPLKVLQNAGGVCILLPHTCMKAERTQKSSIMITP